MGHREAWAWALRGNARHGRGERGIASGGEEVASHGTLKEWMVEDECGLWNELMGKVELEQGCGQEVVERWQQLGAQNLH